MAQVELARHFGYRCSMVASGAERLKWIQDAGVQAVDRMRFPDLWFEESRYKSDEAYRRRYQASESAFLELVRESTQGHGASLFFDHIGEPLTRATSKALGSPGVLATAGWKLGMQTTLVRAIECMGWHMHIHTHYARYQDALEAIAFAEKSGWIPTLHHAPVHWEEIPSMAKAYQAGLDEYFPLFRVNPV